MSNSDEPKSEPTTASPTDLTVPIERPDQARASGEAPQVDLTGKTLGDFAVIRRLGRGGMGEVYLAEQQSLKRSVALKILRAELVKDENYLKRFKAEALTVAPISHPNIVSVIAIGEADGIHYIAFEYVEGGNLRTFLNKKGTLSWQNCVGVLRKVTSALDRAHEAGIIHRDIKPDNVLITRKGEVKVADFGLARLTSENLNLTQPGMTMGTPLYMSPEQIEGKDLDIRTDLYSAGVMAYHMLAGHPPYMGQTAMAVALLHVQGRATPLPELRPDVPPELARIIEKLMAKNRVDRFATPREVRSALSALKSDNASLSPPSNEKNSPSVLRRLEAPTLPRTLLLSLGLLVTILVGASAGWAWRVRHSVAASPEIAEAPAIDKKSEGWLQLMYARIAASPEERLARLRKVIEWHPEDTDETIAAAQELIQHELDQRAYGDALALSNQLTQRDAKVLQSVGYLFRGIVESRQGNAKTSNESFVEMFNERDAVAVPPEQLTWMAREYYLALRANSERLGLPADREMKRKFVEHFRARRS
ncbi:Serine/threonine-protein kinase PknB [Planctomycetes bacterium Pan216]|uniref:non-specific serine/threonine protein kinase n=1 Tax=Kolteria novifilia TaxID=2527975 RepID=A0A518BAS5_9BACT|nr:Serine/threonine-protein kinase PknB [Planctomycetes bacterium Pan216]